MIPIWQISTEYNEYRRVLCNHYDHNFIEQATYYGNYQDLDILNWLMNQDIFINRVNIRWGEYSDKWIEYLLNSSDKLSISKLIELLSIKSPDGQKYLSYIRWGEYDDCYIKHLMRENSYQDILILKSLLSNQHIYSKLVKVNWGKYNDEHIESSTRNPDHGKLSTLADLFYIKSPDDQKYLPYIRWGEYSDKWIEYLLNSSDKSSISRLIELLDIKSPDGQKYLSYIRWGEYDDKWIEYLLNSSDELLISQLIELLDIKSPDGQKYLSYIRWGEYDDKWIECLFNSSDESLISKLIKLFDIKSPDGQKYLSYIRWGEYLIKSSDELSISKLIKLLDIKSPDGQVLFDIKSPIMPPASGMYMYPASGMYMYPASGMYMYPASGMYPTYSVNFQFNNRIVSQNQSSNDKEMTDINTKFLHIESGENNRSNSRASSPKFSIGTPFFRLVISDTYVDKTKLVMEFADYSSSGTDDAVYLITAPRRFGKSKNMEMIKCCLGIELDANNKVLPFTDTYAYKTLKAENDKPHKTISIIEDARFCQAHFAKYPVIFIDCKNATGLTYDKVLGAYRDQIRSTFMEHEYLLKIWKDQNKNNTSNEIKQLIEQFERYIGFETLEDTTLKNGLKILSQWIQKYLCNKKTGDDGCVIILMDEYDAAISFAVNTNQVSRDNMEKIHGFFDDVYSAAFKDNPALFKGLITGISGLVRASAGSRFNNAVHCKFLDKKNKFQKYYGLSVEEVDFILKTINENSNQILKQKITQYYNGYYNPANNSSLYNLCSVIQECRNIFLSKNQNNIVDADDNVECESQDANEELHSYWIESGSIKSLDHIFKMPDIRKIIELLIAKGQINFTFKESLDVDSLYILKNLVSSDINDEGINLFFSYIVELGYLSRQPTNDYIIPNEEIRQEFIKKLCEYFNSTYNIQKELKDAISMFNALIKIENQECTDKQQECFVGALNALFKKMCFADMKGIAEGNHPNEDLFHSVLNLIIIQSLKLCKFGTEITSNNDLIRGRADIVFITKDGIGGIIEVKYDEDAVLQQLVDRALQQIEEKKYEHIFVEHINHGIMNSILKIGIGCNMHLPKNQNRCEPIIDMKYNYSSINDEMICNDTSDIQLMGCNNESDLSAT